MKKEALLIGINYVGTSAQLNGCINDVKNVKKMLENDHKYTNITILTEDEKVQPTRNNILRAIKTLVKSSADTLYLHYSGHGSYMADNNREESDRRDEALVPVDYQKSGLIRDDDIKKILSTLPAKKKLFVVLDCCHSGTGLDLFVNVKMRGYYGYLTTFDRRNSRTAGSIAMLSGCRDDQTSADAYINNIYQGALTHCFLKVLKRQKQLKTGETKFLTYRKLLKEVRKIVKYKGFSQVPQLSFGNYTNLEEKIEF